MLGGQAGIEALAPPQGCGPTVCSDLSAVCLPGELLLGWLLGVPPPSQLLPGFVQHTALENLTLAHRASAAAMCVAACGGAGCWGMGPPCMLLGDMSFAWPKSPPKLVLATPGCCPCRGAHPNACCCVAGDVSPDMRVLWCRGDMHPARDLLLSTRLLVSRPFTPAIGLICPRYTPPLLPLVSPGIATHLYSSLRAPLSPCAGGCLSAHPLGTISGVSLGVLCSVLVHLWHPLGICWPKAEQAMQCRV